MKKEANVPMLLEILFSALLIASAAFIWQGSVMHGQLEAERVAYDDLQRSYYSVAQEVRDNAPADSPLSAQYAQVMHYPTQIEVTAAVGTGKLLTGIYFMLFAVLLTFMMMLSPIKSAIRKRRE